MSSVHSSSVDRHVSSSSPPIMTSSSSNQGSSPLPQSSPAGINVHNGNSNDDCIPSPVPSSPISSAHPGSISPTSSQVLSPSNSNNNVLNLTTTNENCSNENVNKESINNTNGNENKNNNSSPSNNINTSTSSPSAVSTASSSSSPPPPQSSSSPSSVRQSSVSTVHVVQQKSTPSNTETNGNMTPSVTSHPHVNPTSTRPLRLRRVNHSDEIVSGFGKLFKNESLTDVTISCSGGINIKAHRIVLSTFSPYFKSIFESSPFIDTPWTYPVIVMKDYGYTELRAIIEFIYKGEVSVPRDKLSAVLATAKSLEVSGLADLKLDSFGINPSSVVNNNLHFQNNLTSNVNNTSAIHGSLPLVIGSSGNLGSLTGLKRSSDLETSLFKSSVPNSNTSPLSHQLHSNTDHGPGAEARGNNLHESSGASLAKKLRLLESPTNVGATDLSLGSSLSSLQQLQQYAAASGIDLNSLESVRSLLQQPPRVTSFLQQLRQQTQSPLNNNRSSPTVSNTSSHISSNSPTPTRMSNVSLQQIINSQKAAAAAAGQLQQQQQLNNGSNNASRLNPRSLQLQQQHLKQQILQQQLLRSKNFQSGTANNQGQAGLNATNYTSNSGSNTLNQRSSVVTNNSQGNNNHIPFMQFQQRIRQQIQEKHRSLALLAGQGSNNVTNLSTKPLLQKHLTLNKDLTKLTQSGNNLIKVENPVINGSGGVNFNHQLNNHSVTDDDEVEVIIKEGEEIKMKSDLNNGQNESQEMNQDEDYQRKGSMNDSLIDNDESSENLVVEEDSDNLNNMNHSEDIDSENENGSRNNNHRMNEDDEYEIEIDKDAIFQQQQQLRLQQIQKQQQNYQLQLQLEQEEQEQRLLEYHQSLSQATPSSEGDGDQDSSNTGFGFDWQEGFTDDFPHSGNKDGLDIQSNGGLGNQRSTPLATPDFLQPRGPGRPRKGNKAQEISPCPECNKVFVRPDVLKLHYRSVHLNERHPCNLCPKIFKWPGDLSKHKRTKHPDKYPPANANNSIVVHH